jgi:hypothetical protein
VYLRRDTSASLGRSRQSKRGVVLLKRIVAVAFVGLLALAVMAPAALAEERVCRGTIGRATVDNLRVPQGASCTLNGTRVQGTIKVENNANLVANGVRVIGNVQSEGLTRYCQRYSGTQPRSAADSCRRRLA